MSGVRDRRLPWAFVGAASAILLALRLLADAGFDLLGVGYVFLLLAVLVILLGFVWRRRRRGVADAASVLLAFAFLGLTFLTIFVPAGFALALWIVGAICLALAVLLAATRAEPR